MSGEWISVKDRLPEEDTEVLVYDSENSIEDNHYFVALYSEDIDHWSIVCNCYDGSSPWKVTHWQPLPEPPKE